MIPEPSCPQEICDTGKVGKSIFPMQIFHRFSVGNRSIFHRKSLFQTLTNRFSDFPMIPDPAPRRSPGDFPGLESWKIDFPKDRFSRDVPSMENRFSKENQFRFSLENRFPMENQFSKGWKIDFLTEISLNRTNRAMRRLTSEVGRDPVHSTRHGRQR